MIATRKQFQKRTKTHQGIFMIHSNTKLTQSIASGATAIAVLAGVGMIAAPQAEAAQLTCTESSPCALSDLLDSSNFFVTEDKLFGDFSYIPTEGDVPEAQDILVYGKKVKNKISIVFDASSNPFTALFGTRAEALLSHKVTILDPNLHFKKLHLSFEAEGPFAGITETVFDANSPSFQPVAQLEVNAITAPFQLIDEDDVSELKLKSIRAEKDIELLGAGPTGARISIFRQSYTQDIPEPATVLGLLTVGGLGLVFKRKQAH